MDQICNLVKEQAENKKLPKLAPELLYKSDIPLDFLDIDQFNEVYLKKYHLIPTIFHTINETISNNENLRNFLNNNMNSKKWLIASDYATGDQNKKGNFITFTLIPNYFSIDSLMRGINKLQYKDIKNTRDVNVDFLKFMNSGLFFHISIELPDDADLLIPNINKHFELLLESMLLSERYKHIHTHVRFFREKLKRQIKNNLLLNIELVACVVSSINLQIFKAIPHLMEICWFSDRDKILTNFGQKSKDDVPAMIFNIIDIRSKALFEAVKTPFSKNYNLVLSFGKPEAGGKMWYDPLIRIPDYIAGTLADNDQEQMTVTKEKFSEVIKIAIADSKYHLIFRLNLHGNNATATETQYRHVK